MVVPPSLMLLSQSCSDSKGEFPNFINIQENIKAREIKKTDSCNCSAAELNRFESAIGFVPSSSQATSLPKFALKFRNKLLQLKRIIPAWVKNFNSKIYNWYTHLGWSCYTWTACRIIMRWRKRYCNLRFNLFRTINRSWKTFTGIIVDNEWECGCCYPSVSHCWYNFGKWSTLGCRSGCCCVRFDTPRFYSKKESFRTVMTLKTDIKS